VKHQQIFEDWVQVDVEGDEGAAREAVERQIDPLAAVKRGLLPGLNAKGVLTRLSHAHSSDSLP
jgi:hypothetical protein